MKKIIVLALLFGFLVGCSNLETPVGIGHGRDKLKKSPCACETFYDYSKGGWLNAKTNKA